MNRKIIALLALLSLSATASADVCEDVRKRAAAIMTLTQEYSDVEIASMMPAHDTFGLWLVDQAFAPEYPTGNLREQILFSGRMYGQCRTAQAEVLKEAGL